MFEKKKRKRIVTFKASSLAIKERRQYIAPTSSILYRIKLRDSYKSFLNLGKGNDKVEKTKSLLKQKAWPLSVF